MMVSNLSTNPQDEKKYVYDERQYDTFGLPIGINVDYIAYRIPTKDVSFTLISGIGFRFNTEYQYGNWGQLEGDLGDHGLSFGLMVFWGLFGSAS